MHLGFIGSPENLPFLVSHPFLLCNAWLNLTLLAIYIFPCCYQVSPSLLILFFSVFPHTSLLSGTVLGYFLQILKHNTEY